MSKILITAALVVASCQALRAQHTPPTSAPEIAKLFYNGAADVQYICYAEQKKKFPTYVKRSDSTLTSIVVLTNTATVTTAQLAQVVKAVLDALIAHGLIGA